MAEIGMDPEQVLAIAARLDAAGRRVDAVGSTVERLVATSPAIWRGTGAQLFVADWQSHRARLTSAASALRQLATKARGNAQAQIRTSNEYGSIAGGGWASAEADVSGSFGSSSSSGGCLHSSLSHVGHFFCGVGHGLESLEKFNLHFAEGVGQGLWGMVKGVGTLGWDATGLGGWHKFTSAWEGIGFLGSLADPMATIPAVIAFGPKNYLNRVEGLGKGLTDWDEWSRDPGKAAGNAFVNIGTFFVPGADAADAAKTAALAADAGKTADVADAAGHAGSAADAAGHAGDAGGAEHAGDASGAGHDGPGVGHDGSGVGHDGSGAGHDGSGAGHDGSPGTSTNPLSPYHDVEPGPQELGISPDDPRITAWADRVAAEHPGLTPEGVKGIYDYTTNDGYRVENAELRDPGSGPDAAAAAARVEATEKGLSELPKYDGTSFRGTNLPNSAVAQLSTGRFSDAAFQSTSLSPDVAKGFYSLDRQNPTEFTIHGSSGANVGPFSAAQKEAEILYPDHTQFQVLDNTVDADGVRHVVLQEVP